MNHPIWESSVFSPKAVRTAKLKIRRKQVQSSFQKHRAETPLTQTSTKTRSFFFETAKTPNKLDTSPGNTQNLKLKDNLENTDRCLGIIENVSLEKYMQDIAKEENSKFVVHNFARPRRLVTVKLNSSGRSETNNSIETPIVRLGMTGWKLVRPKINYQGLDLRSKFKYINKNLEVVSRRIV